MKSKYVLLLLFLFFIVLQFSFSLGIAPLSDDIGHYASVMSLRNGEISSADVYKQLFDDPNRYTRPLSPVIFGTIIILSVFSNNLFFLWSIFYLLYTSMLYKIINNYFKNQAFAIISCILLLLFPLSSSSLYSPVMQSVQVVVGFFLWTVLLCKKERIIYHYLIGVLSLASLLFYELNLFLLPLLGLILIKHKEKRFTKFFLAIILPIILAFSYKMFFVKVIYPNYFDYSSSKILLNLNKIKQTPIALIKLFTTDAAYIVIRSFKAISFYGIWDFVLLALGILFSILFTMFIESKRLIERKEFGVLILFFLSTTAFFFVSNYPPIAFGFENRILLWVRISSSLLLAAFLSNILFLSKKKIIINTVVRLGIFVIIISGVVSLISQKNAWIQASKYNETLVKNLEKAFPNSQEELRVMYITDKNKKHRLITDESTVSADYEISAALKLYTPQAKFNPNNIIIVTPASYSLYQIGNIQFNKRPAFEHSVNDRGVTIGKTTLNYPFFIYDDRDNVITKIENQHQFKIP